MFNSFGSNKFILMIAGFCFYTYTSFVIPDQINHNSLKKILCSLQTMFNSFGSKFILMIAGFCFYTYTSFVIPDQINHNSHLIIFIILSKVNWKQKLWYRVNGNFAKITLYWKTFY